MTAEGASSAPDNLTEKDAGEATEFAPGARVAVLLPLPLKSAYDYLVPDGLTLNPGDFVEVPLGGRTALGAVWGAGSGEVAADKLKPVAALLDTPGLEPAMRRFVDWVAAYTLSSPGAVLRMAMSIPEALRPPAPVVAYKPADTLPDGLRMTGAREKVLAVARERGPEAASDLARAAGVSAGVVKGLADQGGLEAVTLSAEMRVEPPDPGRDGPSLSPEQRTAADALTARVEAQDYATVLLEGVTGSGKTEVYFEAVAAALRAGRQVLVLLPEIALSAQWLDRFEARFGAPPVLWHSDVGRAHRRQAWRAVARGEARVVVGARSALFLPFRDLGLIVVDEEHDASYKQEDGVIYHARDMAVVRGHLGGFPVVLASATPSLETVVNVEQGRYARLHLPSRHGGADLPAVELIDMRRHAPPTGKWLSPPLAEAVDAALEAGEQTLLFLNRRGYAPLTLCRTCGHRFECPQCSAWLVEHRLANRLSCHHCGFATPTPDVCPQCSESESLVACGPGVERLAEEVAAAWPEARTAVLASDTVHGPSAAAALVRAVRDHEIDILIGTQIIAKGHHFPMLTLVGVVDADLGLGGGDLRAAERTHQLLSQVAGRAGREARPGKVLLQTYKPDEPVMQALAAGRPADFVEAELADRERFAMPPFGRLAALIVSGKSEEEVAAGARALARAAPQEDGVLILGPAPAPLRLLRGMVRYRLLVKAPRGFNLQSYLRRWLRSLGRNPRIRIKVDIDPYSFL